MAQAQKARMSARARPSPWGGGEADVEVEADDHSLVIRDGQRRTVLASKDVDGTAGFGVFRLTSPQLSGQVELDVLDHTGLTATALHKRNPDQVHYQWFEELGFRDVLAALEGGGAKLALHGQARLQRTGNTFSRWVATPLLAIGEGVLAGVGGDVVGRAIGGHLSDSAVTSLVVAVLGAIAVASGVIAMPYRALHAARGSARSALDHYDAMSWRSEKQMGAVFAATLPFIKAESETPRGTAYSVLPWRPRWRLPVLGACAAVCAVATATDPDLGDGWAGGTVGGIARLATVVIVLVTYYLPSSGPVEVPLRTALRVRTARTVMYAAFWICGIAALVIAS